MTTQTEIILGILILIVGLLYSSVGHAGASGYLAVMGLVGVSAAMMKPTALVLNILVATIGTIQFWRAGHFRWALFWPFALTSVPLAYLGGTIHLAPEIYKPLIGATLLFSAWRIALAARNTPSARSGGDPASSSPPLLLSLIVGGLLGLLSGMTGVGGGIFLSPILLLCRWADPRKTAAVSAAFILVNSISGIAGLLRTNHAVMPEASTLALLSTAAVLGGLVGSYLGARRFDTRTIRRTLAVVLVIAGAKLVWEGADTFVQGLRSPASSHANIR